MNNDFSISTVLETYTGSEAFVRIPAGITAIGKRAFYRNERITEVTIPEGVTQIGESAFEGCDSLTAVHFPESLQLIGQDAFSGCSELRSIRLPENVTLDTGAFSECWSLAGEDGMIIIGDTLYGCILDSCPVLQVPDGIRHIADYIEVPRDIEEVILPDSLETIGAAAFAELEQLVSVHLPAGLRSIGEDAFLGCYCLRNINVPVFAHIGTSSFSDCLSLCDSMGRVIVNGVFFQSGPKSSPTLVIPEGVTRIDENADIWMDVDTVVFPDSLRVIGKGAFPACRKLNTVNLPDLAKLLENTEIRLPHR